MAVKQPGLQDEIVALIDGIDSEADLAEIKSLLLAYLSHKVVQNADAAYDARQYTSAVFEQWKTEHFRKSL